MSHVFQNMNHSDVHLRLAGTWVYVLTLEGWQACLVQEVMGVEEENGEGYVDFIADRINGYFGGDHSRVAKHVQEVRHDCPALGYVMDNHKQVVWVSRVPERQSRSGLPGHSTTISFLAGADKVNSMRLQDLQYEEASFLVDKLYSRQASPIRVTREALSGVTTVLSNGCYIGRLGKDLMIFGAFHVPVGTISQDKDEAVVKTLNPITVSTLLGGTDV